MNLFIPLVVAGILGVIGAMVGPKAGVVFGIGLPYAAMGIFLAGFVYRILKWAKAPVPFRITTTCGQQKSLPWFKHAKLDSPFTPVQTMARMALEVLCFRSLFRNSVADTKKGRLVYGPNELLWAAALAFHYSFLIIFLRHYRFFAEPVPFFINGLDRLDSFFEIGLPPLLLSDVLIVGALSVLLLRRLVSPQLRYISQAGDYFPLFLILGIALTGMAMRYIEPFKVPIQEVKQLAMGLVTLHPYKPPFPMPMFYAHITLVSALFICFPFSKLMHMGGIFLSPTRNLPNNSRAVRHINPWNPVVKTHTYAEWEHEFRDKIEGAGIPLDSEQGAEAVESAKV